jgi:hypothetical protein
MALGTLARYGPQHGHQIRRLADVTNVGEWGGVSVGALYWGAARREPCTRSPPTGSWN